MHINVYIYNINTKWIQKYWLRLIKYISNLNILEK